MLQLLVFLEQLLKGLGLVFGYYDRVHQQFEVSAFGVAEGCENLVDMFQVLHVPGCGDEVLFGEKL